MPKAKSPLTETQREYLDFIKQQIKARGFCPSIREIAAEFHVTVNGVVGHLRLIEKKGYIKREPSIARGIRLLKGTMQ